MEQARLQTDRSDHPENPSATMQASYSAQSAAEHRTGQYRTPLINRPVVPDSYNGRLAVRPMERPLQRGTPIMQAQPSVLVVVEKEAVCPYWMEHWGPAPEGDWSMIEQEEWEPDASFAERLGTTLARCSAEESDGEIVVFVASSRKDAAAMAERWSRATSLMSHL